VVCAPAHKAEIVKKERQNAFDPARHNKTTDFIFDICVLTHRPPPLAWFRLAAVQKTSVEMKEATMPANARLRALCVDDSEDCRDMLSTALRFCHIEARVVATATEALSLIQTESYDLYLLDARLPDLDGFELCRRMRDFDAHTPILFFSAAPFEADKKRGMAAGANDYVTKPNMDVLLRTIPYYVTRARDTTAKIIPFRQKTDFPTPFTIDPEAA
jgi:CheY-like chemotaxis protein